MPLILRKINDDINIMSFWIKYNRRTDMERCKWINLEEHENYIAYHDKEWGIPSYDDKYLFEMIVLESFHCGLSC